MKITEIYEHYKIPPNLQIHQLRVTAVAKIICDNFEPELDSKSIIIACLLHDMGNIIKFNFDIFDDDFYAPQGREFWKQVQAEFINKYGEDEHLATEKIAREIGVNDAVMDLIQNVEFSKSNLVIQPDFGKKIRLYADCRVTPHKIASLKDKFEDSRERYVIQKKKYTDSEFKVLTDHVWKLEQQIFKHCKIKPSDVTDENVNPLIEDLKNFKI